MSNSSKQLTLFDTTKFIDENINIYLCDPIYPKLFDKCAKDTFLYLFKLVTSRKISHAVFLDCVNKLLIHFPEEPINEKTN